MQLANKGLFNEQNTIKNGGLGVCSDQKVNAIVVAAHGLVEIVL